MHVTDTTSHLIYTKSGITGEQKCDQSLKGEYFLLDKFVYLFILTIIKLVFLPCSHASHDFAPVHFYQHGVCFLYSCSKYAVYCGCCYNKPSLGTNFHWSCTISKGVDKLWPRKLRSRIACENMSIVYKILKVLSYNSLSKSTNRF